MKPRLKLYTVSITRSDISILQEIEVRVEGKGEGNTC